MSRFLETNLISKTKAKTHGFRLLFHKLGKCLVSSFCLLLIILTTNVSAVEPTTSTANEPLNEKKVELIKKNTDGINFSEKRSGQIGFSDFLITFISLISILLFIIFIAWLVKRSGFVIGGNNQLIRLLASIPVGQKERVALIQVGNEQILIGVAAGNVQKLHVLKEPIEINEKPSDKIDNNIFELALKKYQNRKGQQP